MFIRLTVNLRIICSFCFGGPLLGACDTNPSKGSDSSLPPSDATGSSSTCDETDHGTMMSDVACHDGGNLHDADAGRGRPWQLARFLASPSTYARAVWTFHLFEGQTAFELTPSGNVALLVASACSGQHRLLTGTISPEHLAMIDSRIKLVDARGSRQQTVCDCIHCGSESLEVEFQDSNLRRVARPGFSPVLFCGSDPNLVDPFPAEIVDLADSLREAAEEMKGSGVLSEATPEGVWVGVIHSGEAPGEYLPPSIPWTLEEVRLSDLALESEGDLRMGRQLVRGDVALRALALCEQGQESWPDSLVGLDTDPCAPELFFVARESEVDYLVACEPALPGRL